MTWYFRDSKGVQGPLTEAQLREILSKNFESTATAKQGDSSWFAAEIARNKFIQLDNEGIYLRSDDKIYGPFVARKAEELKTKSPDQFDSYKIGKDGKWIAIENWTTVDLEKSTTTTSSLDLDNLQSPTIGIKEAVTPLISFAKQSAEKIKDAPPVQESMKKTKKFVKSSFGIKFLLATSVLLLISAVTYKLLFDRETPEERLSRALGDAVEDMQAEIEEQSEKYATDTKISLDQASTEIEQLRATIKEARLRSKQQELEQNLRDEFESMSVRLEGELHILEEKEKARVAAEIKRSEAKQKQEQLQVEAVEAQSERKRVCERLFAKVDVSPDISVRIADLLSEFKATLELRGADYQQITQSLKDQNWLDLINTLLKKNYTELPDTQVIESAVETLANYDFQILLRIVDPEILQYVEKPESEIKLMTTWVANSQDNQTLTLCDRQSWTKHPDGIGFVQEWKASQGQSVITLVKQKAWMTKRKELSDSYGSRVSYLQHKFQLGEIPSDLLPQFYANLQLEFLQSMTGWALGQNPLAEEGTDDFQIRSTSNGSESDADSIEREGVLSQFVGKKLADSKIIPSIHLPMRWIAPGKFEIGSSKLEVGRGKNESRVKVSITDGFWISETEVTQEIWKSIMNTEPWQPKMKQVGPRFPATCVSWIDCREFTRRLSNKARREKLIPSNWEFSLPTESQWELACRGGSDSAFSFGDDIGELEKYAWFTNDDSPESEEAFAREVATKQPNQYELFDMHGNVMEWCLDSYSEQPVGGTNPLQFLPNSPRIYRGGSWARPPAQCRSAFRGVANEEFWETDLGFRLVLKPIGLPSDGTKASKEEPKGRYPASTIVKPREGFYVCSNNNESAGKTDIMGLVFSGELTIYTNSSPNNTPMKYEVVWVKIDEHPLEKRGFIVYERPVDPREIMVIEQCNGSEFLIRYIYASPAEQVVAFEQPSLYPPAGTIVGQWKNRNLKFNGPGPNASEELKKIWPDLLKKHAPRIMFK